MDELMFYVIGMMEFIEDQRTFFLEHDELERIEEGNKLVSGLKKVLHLQESDGSDSKR